MLCSVARPVQLLATASAQTATAAPTVQQPAPPAPRTQTSHQMQSWPGYWGSTSGRQPHTLALFAPPLSSLNPSVPDKDEETAMETDQEKSDEESDESDESEEEEVFDENFTFVMDDVEDNTTDAM